MCNLVLNPFTNPVMLDDAIGSPPFSTDPVTFVTCAQCEAALVCEENKALQAHPVFSGKCQSGFVLQGMKPVHVCPAGGHSVGLRQRSSCSSRTSEQIAELQPSSLLLVYWPASCYLPHTLDTMLEDTTNPLAMSHIDVL